MKAIRNLSTNDFVDNRLEISNHKVVVPKTKLSSGSVTDKYPVTLDDGKTIIFISDKTKESETKKRYELRVANRFIKFVKNTKK